MSANNIVCMTDSDGNTYSVVAPNEAPAFHYSDLRDGTALIVIRIKIEELWPYLWTVS
jgi:hypothetical protein